MATGQRESEQGAGTGLISAAFSSRPFPGNNGNKRDKNNHKTAPSHTALCSRNTTPPRKWRYHFTGMYIPTGYLGSANIVRKPPRELPSFDHRARLGAAVICYISKRASSIKIITSR